MSLEGGGFIPGNFSSLTVLKDNYNYLITDPDHHEAILIDCSASEPLLTLLRVAKIKLRAVLLTHSHKDHTAGLPHLSPDVPIYAHPSSSCTHMPSFQPLHDSEPLSPFTHRDIAITPLFTPGHTSDSVCFSLNGKGKTEGGEGSLTLEYRAEWGERPAPDPRRFLFTGDTLFPMGCGRVFDGTPAQLYGSLQRIGGLPADTVVLAGHEYTQGCRRFAHQVQPSNTTVRSLYWAAGPSSIGRELATNPFMRCSDSEVIAAAGEGAADPAAVFARIRDLKDRS